MLYCNLYINYLTFYRKFAQNIKCNTVFLLILIAKEQIMAAEEPWVNHAKDVLVAELGQEEYERRLEKQNELYKVLLNKIFSSIIGKWMLSILPCALQKFTYMCKSLYGRKKHVTWIIIWITMTTDTHTCIHTFTNLLYLIHPVEVSDF